MDSLSVCEKNKDGSCGEKLKKITFENTFDKLPFELEIFALKLVEKTSKIDGKN